MCFKIAEHFKISPSEVYGWDMHLYNSALEFLTIKVKQDEHLKKEAEKEERRKRAWEKISAVAGSR